MHSGPMTKKVTGTVILKGKVEKDEENNLIFSFSAFGKISLGKLKAHATKSGSTLNLTFDATKLVQILTKVSSAVNADVTCFPLY